MQVKTMAILMMCAVAQADEAPIGVFDSGLGGLTVLERLLDIDQVDNATGRRRSAILVVADNVVAAPVENEMAVSPQSGEIPPNYEMNSAYF